METFKLTREIPVEDRYDIIVAGGGPAGTAAVICASKLGAKVLGSCLNRVHIEFLFDECRDEISGDAFEIEGEFTDSDIPTEQALMHAAEGA